MSIEYSGVAICKKGLSHIKAGFKKGVVCRYRVERKKFRPAKIYILRIANGSRLTIYDKYFYHYFRKIT